MEQKVALVTGASSGIGIAVTRRLSKDGYAVFAAGRDKERTEQVRQEIPAIQTWTGDITSPQPCTDLVAACVDAFGRLDLLVNNAGIYQTANAEETTDELWSQTIGINLSATFFLSRAALPQLRLNRGAIVNIASDWGLIGGEGAVAYCASKGGVVLMTKAMALDHAKEGIRINAICPGDVETPMMYRDGVARGLDAAAALSEANEGSGTGRVTTPEEVAALVAFLGSQDAVQITGSAIPIDGGSTAG
jgi:meso-butanediol dehydrogenase/(S,S)-butanediol dehydrogenase/diacetyl reductase